MLVLLVGDVHGKLAQLAEALWQAKADFHVGAAIQVGDFGFCRSNIEDLRDRRIRFPVPLHVIDGNHEDHSWLRQSVRSGAAADWRAELNLIYQARPSVARLGATRVGFIGGALHVHRPQRHNLFSRSPNYILRRQREQATALFNKERPELIVTHSCPARIGIGLCGSCPDEHLLHENVRSEGFDPGPDGDCGEVELSRLWLDLVYRPRAWSFGHFHRVHEATIEGTRFICVGDAPVPSDGSFVLWDTEEKRLLLCPVNPSLAVPSPRRR